MEAIRERAALLPSSHLCRADCPLCELARTVAISALLERTPSRVTPALATVWPECEWLSNSGRRERVPTVPLKPLPSHRIRCRLEQLQKGTVVLDSPTWPQVAVVAGLALPQRFWPPCKSSTPCLCRRPDRSHVDSPEWTLQCVGPVLAGPSAVLC